MNIFLGYLIVVSYLSALIFFAMYLYQIKHIDKELTRKLIHIGSVMTWFMMVYFFKKSIHLVIVPIIFIIINIISYKYKLITAMERNDESSIGTIYYAISLFVMSLISYLVPDFLPYYGIGFFIMALGDGFASVIGRCGKKKIGKSDKTYLGSMTVFIITFLIFITFNKIFSLHFTIFGMLFYSLLSSIIEFYGKKGFDNIALPLGISILSYMIRI